METEFRQINLNLMEVHPRVQRELDLRHVQDIIDHFNMVAVNPLTVMIDRTGTRMRRFIIDGQHTFVAAKKKGIESLWCKIVTVDSIEDINLVFHLLNEHVKPISTVDSFSLNSEHDSSTTDAEINQILKECYLRIGKDDSFSCIKAAGEIRKSHRRLGQDKFALAASFWEMIACGGNRIDVATIRAVTDVTKKYGDDELDVQELSDLFANNFANVKAKANSQCVGSSLAQSHKILTEEIEFDALGVR